MVTVRKITITEMSWTQLVIKYFNKQNITGYKTIHKVHRQSTIELKANYLDVKENYIYVIVCDK